MIRHLFLSPHFDDAIGSCGGTIWRLVSAGHAVRILTVFGGLDCQPLSMPAQILHGEWQLERPVHHRRLEDASACQFVRCVSTFLEFLDAIYRQDADGRHLYPTFESLRGPIAPADCALANRVAAELKGYLSNNDTVVYCPLALGAHVDHVIIRACGRILETRNSTVVYYRDFHYDKQWSGEVDDSSLTRVDVILTRQEIEKKLAAFSEYASQISDLFGTRAGMMSYFVGTGKDESFYLPRQSDSSLLRMLWSVLTRESAL